MIILKYTKPSAMISRHCLSLVAMNLTSLIFYFYRLRESQKQVPEIHRVSPRGPSVLLLV